MADDSGKDKDKKQCSGEFCSCPECGGRKRKEQEAKKNGGGDI